MAGLVPAIHKLMAKARCMDGRHKGGHDDNRKSGFATHKEKPLAREDEGHFSQSTDYCGVDCGVV
jgi:hypothetical protein